MGRAPNPGGPQRVSAHVVAKAKPFSEADEDERTNIESPWAEEGSTTVDQGEVAERIRAFGVDTPGTPSRRIVTNVSSTGEAQLDELTVDEPHAISAISAISATAPTRLVIAQGNETGREIVIVPGKTYTIGRGLDNDVVLTDIAVSRKHFDLRDDDGVWVVVDRGSGNGTVVNGNVEDNPFMLANGDLIEIGNTIFRFEQQHGARRPSSFEIEADDDELSTVAGKPVRQELLDPIDRQPQRSPSSNAARPKTLPPPAALRPQATSQPPPGYSLPQPHPASTLPLPQMANRPVLAPQAPTLLVDEEIQQALPGTLPTTLPGLQMARPPAFGGYPQAGEIPPQSVHTQRLRQTQHSHSDRPAAHVPPTEYSGLPTAPQPPRAYVPPQLTQRAKYILAGTGLTLLAAVVTIAILKSGTSTAQSGGPRSGSGTNMSTREPAKIDPPRADKVARTDPPMPDRVASAAPPSADPLKVDPPRIQIDPPKAETPKVETPKVETPKVETPKAETPKVETPKAETPKAETPKAETPKAETPRTDFARNDPAKPTKATKRASSTTSTSAPKHVASIDLGEATSKADALYRSKKFSEASNVLAAAARTTDGSEAQKLRHTADLYTRLGRALMAAAVPASNPTDIYEQLQSASNFDHAVGGVFDSEIQSKLAQVAPKAAIQLMANKDYTRARNAVILADSLGVTSETIKTVKQSLEHVAGELFGQARQEMPSNPDAAKEKLRQIEQMVDQKSPWYAKASALLKSS